MKIAVGADERLPLVEETIAYLRQQDHAITYFGPENDTVDSWPTVAQHVAEAVASHTVDEGILLCWTGTGVSMAANKIPGIRAALCIDSETARGARLWNNANILCLSLRNTSNAIAEEILKTWLTTHYKPNQTDDQHLQKLRKIEEKWMINSKSTKS